MRRSRGLNAVIEGILFTVNFWKEILKENVTRKFLKWINSFQSPAKVMHYLWNIIEFLNLRTWRSHTNRYWSSPLTSLNKGQNENKGRATIHHDLMIDCTTYLLPAGQNVLSILPSEFPYRDKSILLVGQAMLLLYPMLPEGAI